MQEVKRVLFSKTILGLLAFLAALNCFLLLAGQRELGYDAASYRRVYTEEIDRWQRFSPEEALEQLEAEMEADKRINVLLAYQQTEDETLRALYYEQCVLVFGADFEAIALEDDPDFFLRQEVRRTVLTQLQHLVDYPVYLDTVHANAARMTAMSFFSENDSFNQRNIDQTDQAFPRQVELRLDRDLALQSLLSTRLPACCVAVFMAALAFSFVLERRRGLWTLIYTTPRGRRGLAWRRVCILLFGSFLSTVFIFGASLLTAACLYGGLGDLGRNVQSIDAFRGLPEIMTVGQFLLLDFLLRVFGMWVVGLILWGVLQACSNLQLAVAAAGALLAAEYAAFTLIPDSFTLVILRYLNLFALIDVPRILLRYLNLNLFGYAVRGSLLTILAIPAALTVSVAACVLLQMKKRPLSFQSMTVRPLALIRRGSSWLMGRLGLFGLELHKLLWQQRSVLVVLLFLAWLGWYLEPPAADLELYDPAAAVYAQRYQGPITENLLSDLQGEQARAASPEAAAALEQLISLSEESLRDGKELWLINPAPYAVLFHRNIGNRQRTDGLILALVLVLALSGLFAYENQSGTAPILRKHRRLFWRKLLLAFLLTAAVWAAYSLRLMALIEKTYAPFYGFTAPARSLDMFAWLPSWVPLWTAALGCLLLRLLGLLVYAAGITLASVCSAGKNRATLTSTGLFLLPAALSAIGIRVFEVLSPLRLFSPLECGTADYLLWSIIALLTLMIARVLWRIPHDRPTGDYLAQFQLWWKRKTAHEHREE